MAIIVSASACAKIILLGEHAVVYGQPAIAVPISTLRAQAQFSPGGDALFLSAPGIQLSSAFADLPEDHPLRFCIQTASGFIRQKPPNGKLQLTSNIPVASGMGSGAAISAALVRILAKLAGRALPPEEISTLIYEVEKIHHGTPSGVDNTVVAYEQPVWFQRGDPPLVLDPVPPLILVIADSGIPGSTRTAVDGVRERHQADPDAYNRRFEALGALSRVGLSAWKQNDPAKLGGIMTDSHALLREIGVSLPALDTLVNAAIATGAWGAKLSGAGAGGNVIALSPPGMEESIQIALKSAGAIRTFVAQFETGKEI